MSVVARRPVRPQRSWFSRTAVVVTTGVVLLVLYPLGSLAVRLASSLADGGWLTVFTAPWFPAMIRDSLVAVGLSSVIAVLVGGTIAWIQERTNAGLGLAGDALPLVPLFLPAIAMAVGWTILASPTSGFLNGALSALGIDFQFDIYTYPGLIFVYVLNGLPYAYLPIAAAFRNLDPSLEEAARISGAGPLRALRTVSLPAVGPSALAGFMLAMVINFSVYSIPAVIATRANIEIPAVRIIRAVRSTYPADFDTATVLSVIVTLFIAVLWVAQGRLIRRGAFAKIGGRATVASRIDIGWGRWVLRALLLVYLLASAVLPFAALAIVSLQDFWQPDLSKTTWTFDHFVDVISRPLLIESVQNALVLGLVGGLLISCIALVLANQSKRSTNPIARAADGVAKLPAAVPHAVIAVAFIFAFAGAPFWLSGTLVILGLAFLMAYIPLATVTLEGSVAQVDRGLEEASAVSGATEGRTFWRIIVPLALPGFFAAWAMVYVRVVSDLAISSLLSGINNPMLGAILLDLYDQGTYSQVAALTLVITVVTVPVVTILLWLGRPRWRGGTGHRRAARRSRRLAPRIHIPNNTEAGSRSPMTGAQR
jgi:iron(III) transport system permease protein